MKLFVLDDDNTDDDDDDFGLEFVYVFVLCVWAKPKELVDGPSFRMTHSDKPLTVHDFLRDHLQ